MYLDVDLIGIVPSFVRVGRVSLAGGKSQVSQREDATVLADGFERHRIDIFAPPLVAGVFGYG